MFQTILISIVEIEIKPFVFKILKWMGAIKYLTPIVDVHDCSPVKTLTYDYYRLLCASHAEQEVSVNALVTPSCSFKLTIFTQYVFKG